MDLGGGLSLVKEIYQKFEESVEECVEACNSYAVGAGESIKKIWDEVISDLDHQNNVKGSDSDVELEYNSATELSSKNKMFSANKMTDSNGLYVSSSKSQNLIVSIPCSKENWGEISDKFESISDSTSSSKQDCDQVFETGNDEKPSPNASILEDNEVTASSTRCKYQCVNLSCNLHHEDTHTGQNCRKILDASKLPSGSTSSPRRDCNQVVKADIIEKLSENAMNDTTASIHEDTLVNTLSSKSQDLSVNHSCNGQIDDKLSEEDSEEIPDASNLVSSHTCSTNQYCVQVRESDDGESCVLSLKKMNDYSDTNKDFQLSNPDKVFQTAQRDDYVEIEAKDCIELEKDLSLIPLRKVKNKSLKKKLQNVFKSLKRSNQVNHYQDECNKIGFANEITKSKSSIPSGHMSLTSQNSIDSGWELL